MFSRNEPISAIFRVNLGAALTRKPIQRTTACSKLCSSTASHITTTSIEKKNISPPLPFDAIPGPTFLENLVTLWRRGIKNYHKILADNFEQYGPIVKMEMPNNSLMVCLSDPGDVEQVFRVTEKQPVRHNPFPNTSLYHFEKHGVADGMLGNGDSWYRHRSSMAPKLLRPPEIEHFASGLYDVADDSVASLKEGRNVDLLHHIRKWATESVAFVTFGYRIGVNHDTPDEEALAFINAICTFFSMEAQLTFSLPLHRYFTTPTLKELHRSLDTQWDVTKSFMKKTRKHGSRLEKGEAFFEMLANDHSLHSEEEITYAILTIFAAGVDTTSMSAASVLYNLSKYHEVQQKLYEEIRGVLGNREKPTWNKLAQMPYLKATIKESLRVTPATLGTTRQLGEAIVLRGFEIPEKTTMALLPISSKASAGEIYGDYENFRPERWLRGTTSIHPFASLPFGFGRRMCVGRRLAEMELSLLIIRFLQRFEIEYCDLVEDKQEWIFNMMMEPAKSFNLDLKQRT